MTPTVKALQLLLACAERLDTEGYSVEADSLDMVARSVQAKLTEREEEAARIAALTVPRERKVYAADGRLIEPPKPKAPQPKQAMYRPFMPKLPNGEVQVPVGFPTFAAQEPSFNDCWNDKHTYSAKYQQYGAHAANMAIESAVRQGLPFDLCVCCAQTIFRGEEVYQLDNNSIMHPRCIKVYLKGRLSEEQRFAVEAAASRTSNGMTGLDALSIYDVQSLLPGTLTKVPQ